MEISANKTIMSGLQQDFEDFFENSLSGYLILNLKGEIIRANAMIVHWTGITAEGLKRKRFSDILAIGGKIFYETHLWPLLRMQGFFDEVALELSHHDGTRLPILLNGFEKRDENNSPQFVRLTVFKATDRRLYEQSLKDAKTIAENNLSNEKEISAIREQFIAVLGHDLRNPLQAILTGAQFISQYSKNESDAKVATTIKRSAGRISEMIDNIMDFARARLGSGIQVNKRSTMLEPALLQVVEELKTANPSRIIATDFNITEPVECDADRISQLTSNLLANALTHGIKNTPVFMKAFHGNGMLEISITNRGKKIAQNLIEKLFSPFTRGENSEVKEGLGLGLYIASQIASAHQGTLTVTSSETETCFTFRMLDV